MTKEKSKQKTEKPDLGPSSYVVGILSIIFAFFTPLAGLILGIVGLVLSKGEKTHFSEKGKKFSVIGIIISIITIAVLAYISIQGGALLY